MHDDLDAQVRKLERLDLDGLREEWRRLYGPPPKLRSPELLRRLLGWRLQADRHGDLPAALRKRLLSQVMKPGPRKAQLTPGTRLAREWQGRRHEVVVTETGYAYDGREYRSLSEVARGITGTRWNGPRFFGLERNRAA